MLVAMRSRSGGIFVKIFLALLAATFALWGIGDIFRRAHEEPLATIGNVTITRAEYEQTLDKQIEGLRGYLGENFSPELVRSLGIHEQVLGNMINNVLLDKEARSLGIQAGDALVLHEIRNNEAFKSNNVFDKAIFEEALRNNRLTEQQYIALLRKDISAQLLTRTFTGVKLLPRELIERLYIAAAERRVADLLVFSPKPADSLPAPTEQELSQFYQAHRDLFTAPEYRAATYMTLSLEDVAKSVNITDKDIKETYEQRQNELRQPEKRDVEQMLFSTQEAANAAYEKLKAGKPFAKVAAASELLNTTALSLGSVAKKDLVGDAAEKVFALTEDQYTAPIQDAFGWHLYRVTEITPGSVPTLDKVAPDLRKELSLQRAQEEIYKIANRLDDTLAGGATLEEAAATVGLKTQQLGPVSANGMAPDGTKVAVPPLNGFLKTLFDLDEKETSTLNNVADDMYFVARVDKVMSERVKSLDEVHGEAVEAWRNQQAREGAAEAAKKTAELLKSGKPAEGGFEKLTTGSILRDATASASGKALPADLVEAIFSLAKPGQSTDNFAIGNGDYAIAVLKEIIPAQKAETNPADRKARTDAIRKDLETSRDKEILEQYFRYLRTKHPVEVNTELMQKLMQ